MQIYSNKVFNNPLHKIEAFDKLSFINALKIIEKLSNKYFLIGYIRYKAKDIFLGENVKSDKPLLYFEVYDSFSAAERIHTSNPAIFVKENYPKCEYIKNIAKIKDYIENGITYEVNYTYPVEVYTDSDEISLYNFLLNEQTTPYNMFMKNNYETVMSFSPELFFKIKNGKIFTKPMKGTIHRGKNLVEDLNNYCFLKNDIKNQSENIMIVDLIRNDLSKISKTGTIKVRNLFDIEKHKTLFQMTSEICSELEDEVSLYEILEALFPCGSITGAPKISTMNVIDEIEKYDREIYCGAIAFLSPEESVFSVPIRILQKNNDDIAYKYFAGGAIVWDSDSEEEWRETITKRKFLKQNSEFKLIETMKSEYGKVFLFEEHMRRLKESCEFFNFIFPESLLSFKPEKDGMVRVLVDIDGFCEIEYKELSQIQNFSVKIAKNRVNSKNIFLYHKTTNRKQFSESFSKILNNEVFDEVYFNENGEITEGSRSNIAVKKNGIFYTPPVKCGLLNGTYRSYLVKNNLFKEKILFKNDLQTADEIYCINSVRGMVKVELN